MLTELVSKRPSFRARDARQSLLSVTIAITLSLWWGILGGGDATKSAHIKLDLSARLPLQVVERTIAPALRPAPASKFSA
jgi:hypothetical protein